MRALTAALVLSLTTVLLPPVAKADYDSGKISIYGIYMVPRGMAAEKYSDESWGGGLRVVLPIPGIPSFIAPVVGLEIVDMLRETTEFTDRVTGLRIEQQTNQNYARFNIGLEAGPHMPFPIRPFVGVNISLVTYGIDTDVVIPDDTIREEEIRQDLSSERHWVFGYDLTLGGDINFFTHYSLGAGYRYIKAHSVPQSLGDGSVDVSPEYGQIFVEFGVMFSAFSD
jgi:opacity protein-like surface antigen